MSTVVFVLGAPGAGKGTQCAKIVERFGWSHLSTGDLLRAEVTAETELGKQAQEIMQAGQMVPTSLVLDLLSNAIKSSRGTRFLVDGFPRTLDQLQDFEGKVQPCDGVLVFTIPDEVAIARLLERGQSSGRADDNEETINNRLSVFKAESQPVIDALHESGRVAQISSEASPDEVFELVLPFMMEMEEKAAAKAEAADEGEAAPAESETALAEAEASPAEAEAEAAPAEAEAEAAPAEVGAYLELTKDQEAALVKIQAGARGMLDRKRVSTMKGASPAKAEAETAKAEAAEAAEAEAEAAPAEFGAYLELTEDQEAALVKIQAGARGMLDRKRVSTMKGAAPAEGEADPAENEAEAEAEAAPAEVGADLELTEDQEAALVKIQAGARGMLDRKRVSTMKGAAPAEGEADPAEGEADPAEGEAASAEGEADPAEGEADPVEGEADPAEGGGDLDLTDAEMAHLINIQAGNRGMLDRKKVSAEESAAPAEGTSTPAEGGAAPSSALASAKIVFVLGGPGAGKGTQCAKIVDQYGWSHLSTGDLLRAEVAAGSEIGTAASEIMKEGKMVPTSMILDLLLNAMSQSGKVPKFLVDGFPRKLDQLEEFEARLKPCDGVLVFQVPDDVAVARLVARGETSGRADDNEETARTRLAVFKEESQPVINHLKAAGRAVGEIDAQGSVDEIFEQVKVFMNAQEGPPAAEASSRPATAEAPAGETSAEAPASGTPAEAESDTVAALPEGPPRTPEERISLDLSYLSEDQLQAVIKIQAAGRGMLDRRRTASMRASAAGSKPVTPPIAAVRAMTPTGAPPFSPGSGRKRAVVVDALAASITSVLVICGPSGVGKGTIIKRLIDEHPDKFGFSVSHTTRAPRPEEVDGTHYHFVSHEVIQSDIAAGLFLEHAEVHTNVYGTSLRAVADVSQAGKTAILDIDVQGAENIKKSRVGDKTTFIFIAPPSMKQLEERLRGRGTETEDKIQARLGNAASEMEHAKQPGIFHETIVNDHLEQAVLDVKRAIAKCIPGTFSEADLAAPLAAAAAAAAPQEEAEAAQPLAAGAPPAAAAAAPPAGPEPPATDPPASARPASGIKIASRPPSSRLAPPPSAPKQPAIVDAPPPASAAADAADAADAAPVKSLPVRQYMDQTVVPILREALRALNDKRPGDPLMFLSEYLLDAREKRMAATGKP